MNYTFDDYLSDLHDLDIPHSKNKERFRDFYEQLGTDNVQRNQECNLERISFIKPGGEILELGCHWGFNCIYFARLGFTCTGLDLSESLIEYGKYKLQLEAEDVQNKVKLIQGWIEDFLPTHFYETVILTETLEHVIDPIPIIKKAAECLSPSGLLYISTPETKTGNNSHLRGFNKKEMIELLSTANLRAVQWFDCKEGPNKDTRLSAMK